MFCRSLLSAAVLLVGLSDAKPRKHHPHQVSLRVEGSTFSIFDGQVLNPYPRNITTASGGTHHCDGTNSGANPNPGPNVITALDQASKRANQGFTYDGTWNEAVDGWLITIIGDDRNSGSNFWDFRVNFGDHTEGGCETEVVRTDEVLWAYGIFNANYLLKLRGISGRQVLTPDVGEPFIVRVMDGSTGTGLEGATVVQFDRSTGSPVPNGIAGNNPTDSDGYTELTVPDTNQYFFKAYMDGSIRSGFIRVNAVTPAAN